MTTKTDPAAAPLDLGRARAALDSFPALTPPDARARMEDFAALARAVPDAEILRRAEAFAAQIRPGAPAPFLALPGSKDFPKGSCMSCGAPPPLGPMGIRCPACTLAAQVAAALPGSKPV